MRYSLSTLLLLTTIVADVFAGRATLAPSLQQAETRVEVLQAQVAKLGQMLADCEIERSSRPPKQ
jgi:hypothetical protein